MSLSYEQLCTVVDGLINRSFDDEVMQLLTLATATVEESEKIMTELLRRELWRGDRYEVIRKISEVLEALANESELLGCIFMAHLLPIANENYAHDICDRIDLWIAGYNSPVLQQHLRQLASVQSNEGVQRHLNELANLKSGS